MSLKQGRQGYLGLGIESTPGTAVAATTTVPFTANTLQGKHKPIDDIAARASRAKDFNSVLGQQWGEGEVTVNADSLNLGFMLKLGTGSEIVNTINANSAYDHIFYTSVSGNTPTTATLYNYQGVDTQQYASMTVDKMTLEVKDALMTVKTTFKGFFPTSGSYTPTTVSGTLFAFDSYKIQLGNTIATVGSSANISDFTFEIQNNADVVFESGQNQPTRVFWKDLKVTGKFTRFFESRTDRDNYLNLTKQALVLTASGVSLAGGYQETLTINLAKLKWTDQTWQTGIDNFFAVTTSFDAEFDPLQGKQYDVVLRNFRSSAYS